MPTAIVQPRSNAQPCQSEDGWPAPVANGRPAAEMRDLLIHDIRSPLAAIRGYAQLLERRARTSQLNVVALMDSLEHIDAAPSHLERLLQELTSQPDLNQVRNQAERPQ